MTAPRFHPEARRDFDEAFAYLAGRSPRAAIAQRVTDALQLISAFPESGRHLTGTFRAVPLHPYTHDLLYRIEADGHATVFPVAHHRRRPGYWRERAR